MKQLKERILSLELLSVDVLSLACWASLLLLLLSYGMRRAIQMPCTYHIQLRLYSDLVYHAGLMLFVGLLGCLVTDLIIKMERRKADNS